MLNNACIFKFNKFLTCKTNFVILDTKNIKMKKIWNKNEKNMEKKCLVLVTSRIVRECILFKWKNTFFFWTALFISVCEPYLKIAM